MVAAGCVPVAKRVESCVFRYSPACPEAHAIKTDILRCASGGVRSRVELARVENDRVVLDPLIRTRGVPALARACKLLPTVQHVLHAQVDLRPRIVTGYTSRNLQSDDASHVGVHGKFRQWGGSWQEGRNGIDCGGRRSALVRRLSVIH